MIAMQYTIKCGKYYTVLSGDDCSLITLNNTIAITLFEAINPSINSGCTNLVPGLAYCVSPKVNWNATSNSTTTTSGYVSAPDPTPTGTTENCYQWHVVVANDDCTFVEDEYGVTFAQLQQGNPNINSACSNLILGDACCVDGESTAGSKSGSVLPSSNTSSEIAASSTSKRTTTTSTVFIPGPTQSGITSGCTGYYLVQSGDSCASIDSKFDISFAQFYAWDPAIGSNCGALWLGEVYCLAGPAVASSTTVPAPAPSQIGITASCNAYTVVVGTLVLISNLSMASRLHNSMLGTRL
jgi:LysM repeat protein